MVEILDTLKSEFPMIEITDRDKNGKQYVNNRWLYAKALDRHTNVIMEVYSHPQKDLIDIVTFRELLTPEENKQVEMGTKRFTSVRGTLRFEGMTQAQLVNFVREKILKYISLHNIR